MASLSLEGIQKVYSNGFQAVKDFNLEIADKEFIIFVGPSGCGKSTTLRMIAGLEDISGGTLKIDGKVMNNVEPKDRDIAMVFQNYALYPHMTVFDNMTLRNFLTVSQKLFPVDRDSVLLWDVQSFVNQRYSLWTSLFQTWMQNFVFRCVLRLQNCMRI